MTYKNAMNVGKEVVWNEMLVEDLRNKRRGAIGPNLVLWLAHQVEREGAKVLKKAMKRLALSCRPCVKQFIKLIDFYAGRNRWSWRWWFPPTLYNSDFIFQRIRTQLSAKNHSGFSTKLILTLNSIVIILTISQDTPCWIELQLHRFLQRLIFENFYTAVNFRALQLLDEVLNTPQLWW